jgi:hypothetical protein
VKIELGSQVLAWRRVWIPDFAMVTRFKHILAGSIKRIDATYTQKTEPEPDTQTSKTYRNQSSPQQPELPELAVKNFKPQTRYQTQPETNPKKPTQPKTTPNYPDCPHNPTRLTT